MVTAALLNGGRRCRTQYWKGTTPAKFALLWFNSFRGEDLNVIFNQNMPNLHNRYKSAERNISHLRQNRSLKTYFVRDIKHLFYIIFCDFNFCCPELTAEYHRNYRLYSILQAFLWNFSFSRFIPIMQIRHILIKDHI